MPDKAYAIVHDGHFLLVGQGGTSGAQCARRSGNHLPGGTVPQNVWAAQQVTNEIEEEMGFRDLPPPTRTVTIPKNNATLLFFVIRVPNVGTLVQNFRRPPAPNPTDEPFESVHAVAIADALAPNFFNLQDWTNWFGEGLQLANNPPLS